jgi:hypothetical protein
MTRKSSKNQPEPRSHVSRPLGERVYRTGVAALTDLKRILEDKTQLREGANDQLNGGWPMLLSGTKTLLKTGATLTTPGSLRWLKEPESVACDCDPVSSWVGRAGSPISNRGRPASPDHHPS